MIVTKEFISLALVAMETGRGQVSTAAKETNASSKTWILCQPTNTNTRRN